MSSEDPLARSVPELSLETALQRVAAALHEDGVDFVASVKTPWHALGLQAALNAEYRNSTGIVLLTPHPRDGYLVDPREFEQLEQTEIRFIKLSPGDATTTTLVRRAVTTPLGFLRAGISDGATEPIGVLTPGERFNPYARLFTRSDIGSQYRPIFTAIDTGLGAYFEVEQPTAVSNDGGSSSRQVARRVYESAVERMKNLYFVKEQLRDRSLFFKRDGTLVANRAVVDDYRSVLSDPAAETTDIALLVTQPWSDLGIVDRATEMAVLGDAVESLCETNRVVIRPHPREDPAKYDELCAESGVTISASQSPLEKELAEIAPELVVGLTSTALLTARVLYGVPAYSLVDRIPDSQTAVNVFGEHFLELTSEYVDPM